LAIYEWDLGRHETIKSNTHDFMMFLANRNRPILERSVIDIFSITLHADFVVDNGSGPVLPLTHFTDLVIGECETPQSAVMGVRRGVIISVMIVRLRHGSRGLFR
jgi:hypothetical protein